LEGVKAPVKRSETPAHYMLEQFLDEYLDAMRIGNADKSTSSARPPAEPGC
jgi:hypothetical protein